MTRSFLIVITSIFPEYIGFSVEPRDSGPSDPCDHSSTPAARTYYISAEAPRPGFARIRLLALPPSTMYSQLILLLLTLALTVHGDLASYWMTASSHEQA